MSAGGEPGKKSGASRRHRRRWAVAGVAVVTATLAFLANVDGTISMFQRVGRVLSEDSPSEPAVTAGPTTPTPLAATPTLTTSTTAPSEPSGTATEPPSTGSTIIDPPTSGGPSNALAWYYLADLSPVSVAMGRNCTGGCTSFRSGPGSLGQIYPQSYLMRMSSRGSLSTSSWNALQACTRLEATVGLDDESDSTSARFAVTRDGGSPVTVATVRTGQPRKIVFDLNGVYRFTLGANLTTAASDSQYAVWGDARIYCTEKLQPTGR